MCWSLSVSLIHDFMMRRRWLRREHFPPLATCSITELGFVRVLAQAAAYELTLAQARTLLLRMKQASTPPFTFLPDSHDISHLPSWVKTAKQTTGGHLAKLAAANGAILATLDARSALVLDPGEVSFETGIPACSRFWIVWGWAYSSVPAK